MSRDLIACKADRDLTEKSVRVDEVNHIAFNRVQSPNSENPTYFCIKPNIFEI